MPAEKYTPEPTEQEFEISPLPPAQAERLQEVYERRTIDELREILTFEHDELAAHEKALGETQEDSSLSPKFRELGSHKIRVDIDSAKAKIAIIEKLIAEKSTENGER